MIIILYILRILMKSSSKRQTRWAQLNISLDIQSNESAQTGTLI